MNQSRWDRVPALYHAASAQPTDARKAFLDRECGAIRRCALKSSQYTSLGPGVQRQSRRRVYAAEAYEIERDNLVTSAFLAAIYMEKQDWEKALSEKAAGHPKLAPFSSFKARIDALRGKPDEAKKTLAAFRRAPQPNYFGLRRSRSR